MGTVRGSSCSVRGGEAVTKENYVTENVLWGAIADAYEDILGQMNEAVKELDDRLVVLEAVTRGMRLPDEVDIAGQTYVKKSREHVEE
jgi:hypothetical protein